MNRRHFLSTGAAASISLLPSAPIPVPVVDTHIHLYDPSRPEGVPWPPKSNAMIYRPTLPARFREVTKGFGIAGAIAVECSPWLEDNQWVLDAAAKDTIILGVVGNLEPEKPEFSKQLERFARDPLFRGIRYGYLWGRDLRQASANPDFIDGLKTLSDARLVLDTANPSVPLLHDVIRISDRVPELRMIIDHLPALYPPSDPEQRREYDGCFRELRQRSKIYTKLSAVLRKSDSRDLKDHKERLDTLYETFGPDRVLFGSDWPNSDPSAPYSAFLRLVQEYFQDKGRESAEKFFWRNSAKVYHWARRENRQPDSRLA